MRLNGGMTRSYMTLSTRLPLDSDTEYCYRLVVEASRLLTGARTVALNSDTMSEHLWELLRAADRSALDARAALSEDL